MRRILTVAVVAALLTTTAWVVHGAAAGSARTAGASPPAAANPGPPTDERALERGVRTIKPASLATQLAGAAWPPAMRDQPAPRPRQRMITQMIHVGQHFLNPAIQGFDVTKPHILVYERLGAAGSRRPEWVSPRRRHPRRCRARPGSFAAACHYQDGTFVRPRPGLCAKRSPQTGARFNSGIPTW
jgi:hypothetical protein